MTQTGCDIAWDKPSGAQLAAAGVKVASLYVGQDNTGKNMTRAVVADYTAHGVGVIVNFEYGAQQMLGGAAQGRTDAALGKSQAIAAGVVFRMAYYSADWQAAASQITGAVIPYLVAARSVTGPGTVGVYGSYYVVKAVREYWARHFPGEKVWLWQTVGWSDGLVYPPIDMYQDGTSRRVGGVSLDYDLIISADAGQFPAPPTQGADVAAVDDQSDGYRALIWRVKAAVDLDPKVLDGPTKGETNALAAALAALGGKADAVLAAVAKLAAPPPVDVPALAASLASLVQPAIVQAVAAGIAPEANQLAVTFEQHLAATLGQPK